jgi:hypothetical protein
LDCRAAKACCLLSCGTRRRTDFGARRAPHPKTWHHRQFCVESSDLSLSSRLMGIRFRGGHSTVCLSISHRFVCDWLGLLLGKWCGMEASQWRLTCIPPCRGLSGLFRVRPSSPSHQRRQSDSTARNPLLAASICRRFFSLLKKAFGLFASPPAAQFSAQKSSRKQASPAWACGLSSESLLSPGSGQGGQPRGAQRTRGECSSQEDMRWRQ